MKYIGIYDSPIGILKIAASDNTILSVKLVKENKEELRENNCIKECRNQLEEYFLEKRSIFDIPIKIEELQGTEFQKSVWKELLKIPYGETWSYKEVAKKVGNEKGVRAVANAIGKNPILIVVPCHRVIGSDGTLTGFGAGLENKASLLRIEKITWKEKKGY